MKNKWFIALAVVALSVCIVPVSFAQQNSAPSAPRYGGVLRDIIANGPRVLSYVPHMGPGDHMAVIPAGEKLVDTGSDGKAGSGTVPLLAEKIDEDAKNLKITWHIRKGVTFHDGSELDAEVVRWNFQQILDAKALPGTKFLKGMKVADKYTLVFDLTEYSNQLVPLWGGWPVITSKVAWDKASGGDLAKGKDWARSNIVGTGPFMLKEFKRDVGMTWVKNPNYWRQGRPYLDGIQFLFIPDHATASAMMQAKEADAWFSPPSKNQVDLMKKGFRRESSRLAWGWTIWINTANPNSKWKDKRLREALEYALDKEAIAKALGFGLLKPLKSLPPEGEWGYDPNYNPRPYNPDKARQLLSEAGYPSGLKAKLLVLFTPADRNAGTAIKQYLDAAGFQIDLDVADPGRFFGTIYNTPPGPDQDLAWTWTVGGANYLGTYLAWFSTDPLTDLSYLGHTPEQTEMDRQAQKLTDVREQAAMTGKLVRNLMDNALVIPVFEAPMAVMLQPWVAQGSILKQDTMRWKSEETWMEKH